MSPKAEEQPRVPADWRDIINELLHASKELKEWRAETEKAEKRVANLKAELAKALVISGGEEARQLIAEALFGGPPPLPPIDTSGFGRAERVLALFAEQPEWTAEGVARREKCPRSTAASILVRLAKHGKLTRVKRGNYTLKKGS